MELPFFKILISLFPDLLPVFFITDTAFLFRENIFVIEVRQMDAAYTACARITAQGQVIQGNIPEMPTEEMEELEDSFYQVKDAYMKLYRENRRAERPLVLQSYMFGNSQMYQILNRLGNLQERVE